MIATEEKKVVDSLKVVEAFEDICTEGIAVTLEMQSVLDSKGESTKRLCILASKDGEEQIAYPLSDSSLAECLKYMALPEMWGGEESQLSFVSRKRRERKRRKLGRILGDRLLREVGGEG